MVFKKQEFYCTYCTHSRMNAKLTLYAFCKKTEKLQQGQQTPWRISCAGDR